METRIRAAVQKNRAAKMVKAVNGESSTKDLELAPNIVERVNRSRTRAVDR